MEHSVGWWQVGVIEEVREEFRESFFGFAAGSAFGIAGQRPVEEGIEGDDVNDFEVGG